MGELLVWLSTHPGVEVRFDHDFIFRAFRIRVVKDRYISEHIMDEIECEIFLKNGKDATDLIIPIINNLYDEIEKEEEKI